MTQKYAEKFIAIAWIVSLLGIMGAILLPYVNRAIDTGVLMNYMPWLFPGQLYLDYFFKASLLTFMLFVKSRLGAILLLFVFISDKLFMLISLHGFDTLYIYTWLITQLVYILMFIMAIYATFSHRHHVAARNPNEGTVIKDLKHLWYGRIPLASAFWAYVGGGLVAILVIPGFSYLPIVGQVSLPLLLLIMVGYLPAAFIGTWRSARKYTGRPVWANLARIGLLLIIIYLIFSLYGAYLMLSGGELPQ